MAVTTRQTNFTAGELSPRMLGRVDIDKYGNGVQLMENMIPLIHGGARSTEGLEFIAEVKDSTRKTRLLKFVFNKTEALMLEMGHQYIRFFDQSGAAIMSGGSVYELTTVFTESQLFEIEFASEADTIFMLHESVHPQRLQRYFNNDWVIEDTPFVTMPFDETGHVLAASLTLSDATPGTGRTVTASSGVFLELDVGRTILYFGAEAEITGYTSTTVVTATIKQAFDDTAVPQGWKLLGSPIGNCKPTASEPVGKVVTLQLREISYVFNPNGGTGGLDIVETTTSKEGWRAEDVGSHVKINGGLVKITAFNTAANVIGEIKQALTSPVEAEKGSWSLQAPVWNSVLGYPRCGAFYEQRLVLAGSTSYPNSWWASRTGLSLDFELGVNDDDAIFYQIASQHYNPILHAARKKQQLVLLTTGGEYLVTGGVEKSLTPTNVNVDDPTDYGCNDVRPVRVGKDVCYVQRGGRKLRAMSYRFEDDDFGSPDLTKLSEHITATGIVDMAYQQEPDSLLWSVLANGNICLLSIDREENVLAWSRQTTNGSFESVESIPGDDQLDNLWVIVKRTVNGVEKRYIERYVEAMVAVHSGVIIDNVSETTAVSGLAHLEAEVVEVVGDETYLGEYTVSAGAITLRSAAKHIEVGLPPLTRGKIKTLSPELIDQSGSSQGNHLGLGRVSVLLLDSYGLNINGEYRDGRQMDGVLLNNPVPKLTGYLVLAETGWELSQPIEIEAATPLPIHILATSIEFTVGRS